MADKIDKFYKTLRNETIDNERKTQREAFELLSKHIELMDKQPERAIKTMTDQQENKIKQLVSEFGISINTIFQNFGKKTFVGIGGVQTRYENLASVMRDILFGSYDTDDKMYALKLASPLIPKLKRLVGLMSVDNDTFKAAEKRVVQVILANMEPKSGTLEPTRRLVDAQGSTMLDVKSPVGFLPAYQPLGTFTELLVINKQTAKPGRPKAATQPVPKTSASYRQALEVLENIKDTSQNGETVSDAKKAIAVLKKGGAKQSTITAASFNKVEVEIQRLIEEEQGEAGPRRGLAEFEDPDDEDVEEYED